MVNDLDALAEFEERIGYRFSDRALLISALTHASLAESRVSSNERLEFLGDAVLDVVVCQELYHRFPNWLEGNLTKVKSAVVSRRICAKVAAKLDLGGFLLVGKGVSTGARLPSSVLSAALESVIGAIYLDGGLDPVRRFILTQMADQIEKSAASEFQRNYKSQLQQVVQQRFARTPEYELIDEKGPDHNKCFQISALVEGRRFPTAWGLSKKEAEQKAAFNALVSLKVLSSDEAFDL
jgi:ribonuclease-3